jgi:replicative DNA helicase
MGLTNELAILGSIMIEPTLLSVVYSEGITPSTFFDYRNREIYTAMLHMQEAGRNIDWVTLHNFLEESNLLTKAGGSAYVTSLGDELPVDYCESQRDYYVGRRVKKLATDLAGAEATGESLLALASEELWRINNESTTSAIASVESCVDAVVDSVTGSKQLFGVQTFYSAIDNIIMGLPPGALITMASRPGMGKSALALNVLKRQGENGIPTGIATMEMTKEELTMRLLAMESGVSTDYLKSGTLGTMGIKNVKQSAEKLRSIPIYMDDSSSNSLFGLASFARRLKAEYDIKVLVVDYLQLMDTQRGENRNIEIGMLTRGLKKLAGELHIPIVAISQLNRQVDNRNDNRPNLSDLRESGNIEQDSDMVVFLYRSSYYSLVGGGDESECEIIIAKNRGGRLGTAHLTWVPTLTTFKDIRV